MTLIKIDHTFANQQLSYDSPPNHQPYIKLSFFFSKLPHVSFEQFHRHWETIHADLTVGTKAFKDNNIQRYVQFHQTPEMKERVKALGIENMDYDGCSEIWVKEWKDWEKFGSSDEFIKALMPDAPRFMALPFRVMAGYDNLIFGTAIPGVGGKDGVVFDRARTSKSVKTDARALREAVGMVEM